MMSKRNVIGIFFFLVIALLFVFAALMTHEFGHPEKSVVPEMDDHIIDTTQTETGADNAVTSVVFDYRGFDTLGEATVLFTAVAGVILLFRRLKK